MFISLTNVDLDTVNEHDLYYLHTPPHPTRTHTLEQYVEIRVAGISIHSGQIFNVGDTVLRNCQVFTQITISVKYSN